MQTVEEQECLKCTNSKLCEEHLPKRLHLILCHAACCTTDEWTRSYLLQRMHDIGLSIPHHLEQVQIDGDVMTVDVFTTIQP